MPAVCAAADQSLRVCYWQRRLLGSILADNQAGMVYVFFLTPTVFELHHTTLDHARYQNDMISPNPFIPLTTTMLGAR
jgi:hypothetical protein